MGGYIAARLAARHPARIAGVVITDILTAWPGRFRAVRASPGRAAGDGVCQRARCRRALRLAPPDPRTPPERVRHLGETGVVARPAGDWTYAFDRRVFLHPPVDPWPFLAQIAVPALVVHGEHSPIMSAASAGRVAAAIPRGQSLTLARAPTTIWSSRIPRRSREPCSVVRRRGVSSTILGKSELWWTRSTR